MAKHLILIFLSIFIYSCATKKVVISKDTNELKVDSVYKEKKDSVSFKQNSVVVKEDIYEMEIVPIDSTKPLVIAGKEFKNASVKIKKSEKSLVDSTKLIVVETLDKNIEVEKKSIVEDYNKDVDRKVNYSIWIWLFVVLVVIFGITKLASKFLL
jgi:regulatory protein YycI of two-component signal transduction system YycFG